MQQEDNSVIRETMQDRLEEGELYVYRKGNLERIQRDEEDTLRKVRIAEEAFNAVLTLQKTLRRPMGGFFFGFVLFCLSVLFFFLLVCVVLVVVCFFGVLVFFC